MQLISSVSAFADVLNSNRNVLVDFTPTGVVPAKWLPQNCRASRHCQSGHVTFVKVNVDEAQELTRKFGVSAMPTFMAFVNGSKVGEVMGADKAGIEKLIANMN